ncbi:TetR/AcrR family transcriptional regulator [Streptomyces syringium]|uniref:TetR/AcrR family transcriptional regulator n=1 Tax=Streptomyces syringium TaxID=76729 RepID=UPI0037CE312C
MTTAHAHTAPDATPCAAPPAGLRGRKRERTRRAISEAAFRLFAEEGFEAVTLTRIAAAAEVAPATVFTHFASKEDIFFGRGSEFDAALPEAVLPAADSAELLDRLHRFYVDCYGMVLTEENDSLGQARVFARILLGSPALRRSYLPVSRARRRRLLELLVERAGRKAESPDVRAELELFASFANAVREQAFEALHASLAAGEPAERTREAIDSALARGFERLALAYGGCAVLDAG